MIEFRNVTKIYSLSPALSDVSFEMKEGCIGLLGPNGAGKTTTLKLISGLIKPSQGEVFVMGENPFNNPNIIGKIGYQPEFEQPYPWMTGRKYLKLTGKLYGLEKREIDERIDTVKEIFGLEGFLDRVIGGYSRGMRQRIKLAQAFIHNPQIILLDEPLAGLDPKWRNRILEFINMVEREGKLIVFSTHLLFDAEAVCDHIIFLYRGRIIASGSLREIQQYFLSSEFDIDIRIINKTRPSLPTLSDIEGVKGFYLSKEGNYWLLKVRVSGLRGYIKFMRSLLDSDVDIEEISISELDLNKIYARILKNIRGEL